VYSGVILVAQSLSNPTKTSLRKNMLLIAQHDVCLKKLNNKTVNAA